MILLMLSFYIFLTSCNSFKEGSEPDGFRNIKWGTNLESLQNMQHIENKLDFGEEIALYIKTDDELIIGGAVLEQIEYSFWDNKFFEVSIAANGYRNCTALKESAIERFGKGKHKEEEGGPLRMNSVQWIGDETGALYHSSVGALTNRCSLTIYSYEISQEIVNQSKQKSQSKVKEGAEKGF